MSYSVIKRNKRLMIVDQAGAMIWTPPDWIRHRIQSRQEVFDLAKAMEIADNPIDPIIAFETKHNPQIGKRR